MRSLLSHHVLKTQVFHMMCKKKNRPQNSKEFEIGEIQLKTLKGKSMAVHGLIQAIARRNVFLQTEKKETRLICSMLLLFFDNLPECDNLCQADMNLFATLLVFGQNRRVNIKELPSHDLGPLPCKISLVAAFTVIITAIDHRTRQKG